MSLITSWLLVVGAFGFLVFYSHRVAVLIQNPDAISRIVDDLRAATGSVRLENRGETQGVRDQSTSRTFGADSAPVHSLASGYLQRLDHARLMQAASRLNAPISIPFRPGQFVLQGEVLAVVSPSSAAAMLRQSILGAATLGRHRVLSQDIEFGLAQMVEIAIRAHSPAVNDTFTGVATVDLLGEALALLAGARQIGGDWYDSAGELRLQVRRLLMPRLIKQAFDQIRQAAADNPAVLIRLLSTLERLSKVMQGPTERDALLKQAAAVWETANIRPLVTMDREDIEAAWTNAREALKPCSSENV